nr:MAG TPA: hypothetical protein [Caudoviricetes sp.]
MTVFSKGGVLKMMRYTLSSKRSRKTAIDHAFFIWF